jgi:hypothetical protein
MLNICKKTGMQIEIQTWQPQNLNALTIQVTKVIIILIETLKA